MLAKNRPDVGQQDDVDGCVFDTAFAARQGERGCARASGPIAAGLIRDGQQRTPAVCSTVIKLCWYSRLGRLQFVEAVGRPASSLSSKDGALSPNASGSKRSSHSLGRRRRKGISIDLSLNVSGNQPISAIAFGHHVEKRRGS